METKPQTPEIFLIDFLHKVGINCDTLNNLDGLCISRDTLLVYKTYEDVKEYIPKLKLIFSTSYLEHCSNIVANNSRNNTKMAYD